MRPRHDGTGHALALIPFGEQACGTSCSRDAPGACPRARRTRQAGRARRVPLRHDRSSRHRGQATRSVRSGHPSAAADLQRASYAVEAELIGFDGIPALHESLEELRDCGESFLGLDDETGLAGAVSWVRLQDGTLDICRLMVHPRAHRRGIATALLDALDRAEPAWRAVVSTGTANHPALGLYKRRGFTPAGTRLIAPGTSLTLLERRSMPPGDPPASKP